MVTVEVNLPREQAAALSRLAAERGVTPARLVEEILSQHLAESARGSRKAIRRKALAAIGAGRSGLHDLAERHDEYLGGRDAVCRR